MIEPVYRDEFLEVYGGDARAVLSELEPDSIDCVVTSPPYWGLRDYGLPPAAWGGDPDHAHAWGPRARRGGPAGRQGRSGQRATRGNVEELAMRGRDAGAWCECGAWSGQLGLEPHPGDYVEHLVDVFRAIRRVLRRDGVAWLNLGDTYIAGPRQATAGRWRLKAKDRVLMPARVAIALQDDGWYVRDEIVWAKPNPMPLSIEDRTTPSHELIYLLSRSRRYRYDAAAIREPSTTDANGRRLKVPGGWDVTQGVGGHGTIHRGGRTEAIYADTPATDRRRPSGWATGPESGRNPLDGRYARSDGYAGVIPSDRNRRSVWTVATEPYPGAHFATFPRRLIEPMILAGAPEGGLVLDPFAGSGTVGLVAQALGRRAVLVDLNPGYVRQALRRAARAFGVGGRDLEAQSDEAGWPAGSLWHPDGATIATGGSE